MSMHISKMNIIVTATELIRTYFYDNMKSNNTVTSMFGVPKWKNYNYYHPKLFDMSNIFSNSCSDFMKLMIFHNYNHKRKMWSRLVL